MGDTLTFSHAVGYRGICSLRGVYFLCTGGNISLSQDPIMGTGVWGAGYEVASPLAYAWNYLNLQGSANFQLTKPKTGNGGENEGGENEGGENEGGENEGGENEGNNTPFGVLSQFVSNDRTTPSTILLKPDGVNGFNGDGWFTQCSFQASQGAAITGSFGFKGDPSNNGMTVNNTVAAGNGNENLGNFQGDTLIPYWNTEVRYSLSKDATSGDTKVDGDIINWNCSGNSDLQMLRCCNSMNSNQGATPLRADYILCGQMTADASWTVFTLIGQFNPKKYHGNMYCVTFDMDDNKVKIPQLVINNASTSMTTGASYVTAEFSYNAVGDGINSVFQVGDAQ